jgi:hypothetical protein
MIDICKIPTPVYGTTDIEINEFINYLLIKLIKAKEDNQHFDWGCVRYYITTDEFGHLWLSGFTKEDAKEI